jgi:hypothetical protein
MLLSCRNMEHIADPPPLTSVQQCVVEALAAGSTITDAAKAHDVHRMTVYRWMKTLPQFSAALHRARVEFILARRDDLYHLSHRALETLLTVLDNPKSSPAVLLRTAMFILQRPQVPKTGWSMPEPAPDPDGNKLTDSAIIEQDYAQLPGLSGIERDFAAETFDESPVMPVTEAATECDEMLHVSPICASVTPAPSAAPRAASRRVAASDLEGTYKDGSRGYGGVVGQTVGQTIVVCGLSRPNRINRRAKPLPARWQSRGGRECSWPPALRRLRPETRRSKSQGPLDSRQTAEFSSGA